jgi:flagellar FliJ protein
MVARDKRWEPLNELAGSAERSQATRMVEAGRKLEEAEQRLQDLVRYRLEYEQSFHARASAGADIRALREHQVFIARLGEAARAQQQLIGQLRADSEAARLGWREAATHKKVVGKVMERARAEDRLDQDRRLQRELDERAALARVTP